MADSKFYEVEKVLGRKVVHGRVLYLVRWRGFSADNDSWEPYRNMKSCSLLISNYKHGEKTEINTFPVKENRPFKAQTGNKFLPLRSATRKLMSSNSSEIKGRLNKKARKNGSIMSHKIQKSKFLGRLEFKKRNFRTKQFSLQEGNICGPQSAESKVSPELSSSSEKNLTSRATAKSIPQRFRKRKLELQTHGVANSQRESASYSVKKIKPVVSTNFVTVKKEDHENEDNDDDILYSLNSDCDNFDVGDKKSSIADSLARRKNKVKIRESGSSALAVITKKNQNQTNKDHGSHNITVKKRKRMSLLDSKRQSKPWVAKSVKHIISNPDIEDPAKPSGNSLPDPVSPEASETYLADVPSYTMPPEEPLANEQPISPGSLSYKSLLNSLPDQFHPSHKGSKKVKGDSSSNNSTVSIGLVGASLSSSLGREPVERRTSVRSTECAFRYKQIVVKKCFRYTQIWLNTQTVMKNALNPQVAQEVVSALSSAKYDDSHLVLFSSLGNVFCSGTDLHFLVSGDRKMAARQMADAIRELTKTFITFPKPIIAAVSGAAVGLGLSLLALCDVVYASDKASFHLPYSQLSQTPEGCSSFTLPLNLGLASANELLYGGRKITAMEAYQLGLVSQVFWPTLMMQEVIPRAQNMATCSAKALEATKLLVRSHHRTKMELTNETECNLLLERWLSVDCQRAIEAYLSNEKNLSF